MKTAHADQPTIPNSENRIGPYIVQERLGEGGMAVIDKVWHTGLHRFEALKLPRQKFSENTEADPAFIHRLLAEARIAARLHHPHIVTIYNISEEGASQPFFSMEYVEGYDLGRLIEQRQRLPLKVAVPILQQVASALDYAHAHGVIHRDVKPTNILLAEASPEGQEPPCAEWHVKVVDFGISRAMEDGSGTKLTKNGMIVGTPEYMSPEQAGSGGTIDHRVDIYALGIVAYEMLCGQPPFTAGEGVSPISVLVKQIHDLPRPPLEHLPHLPRAANDAILQALSKDPDQRFASSMDFVAALSAALASWEAAPHLADAISDTAANGTAALQTVGVNGTRLLAGVKATVLSLEHSKAKTALLGDIDNGTLGTPVPIKHRVTRPTLWMAGISGLIVGALMLHSLGGQSLGQNEMGLMPSAQSKIPVVTKPAIANKGSLTTEQSPEPAKTRLVQQRQMRAIPFTRRVTQTAALMNGQRRISQKGQTGQREVVLGISYKGPHEITRRVLSSRIVKAPVPQVEQVGVRKIAVASHKPAARRVAYKTSRAPSRGPSAPVRPIRVARVNPFKRVAQPNSGGRDIVESLVGDWLNNVGAPGHGDKHAPKRGKHRHRD